MLDPAPRSTELGMIAVQESPQMLPAGCQPGSGVSAGEKDLRSKAPGTRGPSDSIAVPQERRDPCNPGDH